MLVYVIFLSVHFLWYSILVQNLSITMVDGNESKDTSYVKKYDGTNYQFWKLHMQFLFQSKEIYSVVNGTEKKRHNYWHLTKVSGKKIQDSSSCHSKFGKQGSEAWSSSLLHFCKDVVATCCVPCTTFRRVHYSTSRKFYYCCRLGEKDSIITYVNILQKFARQLKDLGEKVTHNQLLSKIKCGLPPSYDPFLLA